MTTHQFNLVDQPWIPVIREDGRRDELSLRETLAQAHRLREIHAETPPITASLHRLLLAILHRNFGPKSTGEWEKLWDARQFDMERLDQYLNEWKTYFDLFDEKQPFFQTTNETELGQPDTVNKALLHIPSGITAVLFSHQIDDDTYGVSLSPAEAAQMVVTVQGFGLGYQQFNDGPCAKGILFFALGDSLFETLTLNLMRYDDAEPVASPDNNDCPAWEAWKSASPFKRKRPQPRGYLDYLTWHNRRLLLIPELGPDNATIVKKLAWSPGLKLIAEDIDPMKHYYFQGKEGGQAWSSLCFDADRALWRDSAVLFQLKRSDQRPPKVVAWLSRLARNKLLPLDRRYRLMALGMSKTKAKLEFLRAETLPWPPDYLTDETETIVGELSKALTAAENTGCLLNSEFPNLMFRLARLILKPNATEDELKQRGPRDTQYAAIKNLAASWNAERYFWSGLEVHFHRLVVDLPTRPEEALAEWARQVRRAAESAFEQAERCVGFAPRTQRAVTLARLQFEGGLRRALEPLLPKEEVGSG